MNRFVVVLGIIAAFAMLCLLAIGVLLLNVKPAGAHGWYSEKKDPVFKHSCCGGTDCARLIVTRTTVSAEPEGIRIRLTLEETRKINPYSVAPIDAVVTWDRVQPSEDGNWHICIMTSHRGDARGGIYCLFQPPSI